MGRALTTRGAVMVALAAAALLSGCAPAAPPAAEPPPASSQPIFASDEEALAAAEAAYARYRAVADLVSHDGGANPDRVSATVTDEFLTRAVQQLAEYSEAGVHSVGNTYVYADSLVALESEPDGAATITFYACVDVSQVDVIDSNNVSVVSPTRPSVSPFEVRVVSEPEQPMLVDNEEFWEGVDYCATE